MLSDEDRGALAEITYDAYRLGKYGAPEYLPMWHELDDKPTATPEVDRAVATVEQIVARHVTAALNDIQYVFDLQCPPRRSHFADDDFGRGAYCAHSWWSTVLGAALRRATDRITPP